MKQYIVDAFTEELFKGNPAAVCVMDKWIGDELMQKIAKENNLSETAFQASERSGVLYAEVCGERVKISGRAVLFGKSEILGE